MAQFDKIRRLKTGIHLVLGHFLLLLYMNDQLET